MESNGNQVKLPRICFQEPHKMHVITPVTGCDNTCEMLPTWALSQHPGSYWKLVMEAASAKIPGFQKESRRSAESVLSVQTV